MQGETSPIDRIFRPAKWLPKWLRDLAARLLGRRVERREAPRRIVMNLTAQYWEGSGAAGHLVRDISVSGAFIFADFKWVRGTVLTITLQRDGPIAGSDSLLWVVVRATVVRQAPEGLGVQFVFADKRERKTLATFLRRIPESDVS
jgi:PilZ domain